MNGSWNPSDTEMNCRTTLDTRLLRSLRPTLASQSDQFTWKTSPGPSRGLGARKATRSILKNDVMTTNVHASQRQGTARRTHADGLEMLLATLGLCLRLGRPCPLETSRLETPSDSTVRCFTSPASRHRSWVATGCSVSLRTTPSGGSRELLPKTATSRCSSLDPDPGRHTVEVSQRRGRRRSARQSHSIFWYPARRLVS